jgi:DNA-binding GntR family transcriptional regulator
MQQSMSQPKKLDEYVADALREQILSGKLKPGARLVEASVAEGLGVSAGTVRAGFSTLRGEGLIRYEPNRGVSVATLTAEDAREIYSLRNYLEALATRLATERLSAGGANLLGEAMSVLDEAVRAGSRADVIRADMGLHVQILTLSGHRRLQDLYRGIGNQALLFMNLTEGFHQDQQEIVEVHRTLVDAILAREVERAESLALSHNTADGEALCALLAPGTRGAS